MRLASLVTLAALVGCSEPQDKDSWSQDTDPTGDTADTGNDTGDTGDTADTGNDTASPVDSDADGFATGDDCDDSDPTVFPGAAETCDGIDQDCDGDIDEASTDATVWYADADADGYGDDAATTTSCVQPPDSAGRGGDCDDGDAAFNPGASEVCTDPTDYNCDGSVGYADADADGVAACEDCDDTDGATFPGADETCNGVDDDCDAEVDEAGAVGESTWYADTDADGYGDGTRSVMACASVVPEGYVADAADCDDTAGTTNPGAAEVCGGADEDCDGATDEDDAADVATWYADADEDGFGDSAARTTACIQPAGTVAVADDCDDTAASTNPAALEVCGGADEDCDGTTDEDDASDAASWYADGDGDGYGEAFAPWSACEAPAGYVSDASDCDDADEWTHPDADEYCGGGDEDCDGTTDEDDAIDAPVWYADLDVDLWGDASAATMACEAPPAHVALDGDCDDSDAMTNPGSVEMCGGADEDCDGTTDEDDAIDAPTWYADMDTDGYGDPLIVTNACTQPASYVGLASDCDDADGGTNPDADEVCGGADEDCDGSVDEDDAIDATTWYADSDADGWGNVDATRAACDAPFGYAAAAGDCDDDTPSVNPDASEVCGGVDEDCDGTTDEDDAVDAPTWYADRDGDLWGDPSTSAVTCVAPGGYLASAGDCDDTEATINPTGTEVCGGADEDCDGITDEDDAIDAPVWYADGDADGFGDPLYATNACAQPSGYVVDATDCDDAAGATNPEADETCGGADEDCDGTIDEDDAVDAPTWYADADGDGYGIVSDTETTCDAPAGYAPASAIEDCNEGDTSINPGATEVCGDFIDNDCAAASDCDRAGVMAATTSDLTIGGALDSDYLGSAVTLGDVNGDGVDDAIAGANGVNNDATTANYGKVYVWYGPLTAGETVATADHTVLGSVAAMNLGSTAIDVVPDIDGDGDDELVVGAYEQNTTTPVLKDPGYAYFLKGGTLAAETSSAFGTILGTAIEDFVGFHLGAAGDIDGDGRGDFFVSAHQRENGAFTNAGQLALYSGGAYAGGTSTLPTAAGAGRALFSGPAASQNLGYGADGAGDMDGDGKDELIVGAPGSSSSTTTGGVAFLVYGGTSVFGASYTQAGAGGTTAVDAVWTGAANGDRLGLSVAGLGDTDGDGYDDVAVSADYSDPGVTNAGRVYVLRGSSTRATSGSIATLADAVLSGESADDYFGRVVQGVGDMNRDGFMDLAVGATGRDLDATVPTVSGAGSAYVFYGPLTSTTGASADFVVRGVVSFDALGSRIAPAGDVDDDGYDDLLLGVAGYDPGSPAKSNAGAVFLFNGAGE